MLSAGLQWLLCKDIHILDHYVPSENVSPLGMFTVRVFCHARLGIKQPHDELAITEAMVPIIGSDWMIL